MTRFFQHKTNKKQYKLNSIVDKNAFLNDIQSGDDKVVTLSTLHRYYEEVQPVQPVQPKADKQPKTNKQTKAVVEQPKQAKQPKQPKPVADKTNKYPYYRHYERNTKPLWNTVVEDNALYCCNENGDKLIKCTLSKTAICIRIEQIASKAKRYFTNFNRAKRHLVYDQDIKTTQYIGEKFDKWLKAQQKRIIEGDK